MTSPEIDPDDSRYRRAARLLAQKLGVDWHDLPAEQVRDYLRKIEIARPKRQATEVAPPPKSDDPT